MKTTFYIIKHAAFVLAIIGITLMICLYSIMIQLFRFSAYNTLGGKLWYMIYVILPLIAASVPIVVKYFRKYSFAKSVVCAVISIGIYATVSLGTVIAAEAYMKAFTPHKWEKYPHERHYMLDCLKQKYKFIGMKAEEVTSLLGKTETPYAQPDTDEFLEYHIGYFSIDPKMLTFELKDGVVVEVYTYTESRCDKESLY